ncbi:hypothetical protein [Mesorhizobium sp. NZP2298]|uniref:hypothetical protein n=1 Tax=Mesorhizobium sp. NZP2298 TaxID=2483403 RepID=UPI00155658B4|nr:hypothetical protein [Mesorhizobium sp. NZP2298]
MTRSGIFCRIASRFASREPKGVLKYRPAVRPIQRRQCLGELIDDWNEHLAAAMAVAVLFLPEVEGFDYLDRTIKQFDFLDYQMLPIERSDIPTPVA